MNGGYRQQLWFVWSVLSLSLILALSLGRYFYYINEIFLIFWKHTFIWGNHVSFVTCDLAFRNRYWIEFPFILKTDGGQIGW